MIEKKFIEICDVEDWEVETADGWEDILAIGKTVPYTMYEITLENGLMLKCANTHIVINKELNECYVEDLNVGEILITKYGLARVTDIKCLNYTENMYDIEVGSINHTYYTNDILSHNSMWMCNMAAKSVKMGYNTAYITLELQREIVHMRIGSNMLNVPLDDYEKFTNDQDLLKNKLNNLRERSLKPMGELHVAEFPSSAASANDIEAYLKKAEELLGYKFDNVFIDYLNIMKNWRNPNSENTYLKIKSISEDVRAMGQRNNWAMISVTQTNRSGWEANDLSITSIAESAGLLHTVDILFGIITTAEMKAGGEYFLKCLANRVAGYENMRQRFTVEWKYARIEQDRNSPMQDMDFFINQITTKHNHSQSFQSRTNVVNAKDIIKQDEQIKDPVPTDTDSLENKITKITGDGLF